MIVAALAIFLGGTFASFANAQSAPETLMDLDRARPQAEGIGTVRVENWFDFQRNIDGSELWQYWPRFYIPFNLSRGWTFTQRVDLPISHTDGAGPENPAGKWKSGLGDWFVEEIVTTPAVAKKHIVLGERSPRVPDRWSRPVRKRSVRVGPGARDAL